MGPHGYMNQARQAARAMCDAPLTLTDVKFDNIVIEYKMEAENQIHIQKVNLADLESAAKVGDSEHITGI